MPRSTILTVALVTATTALVGIATWWMLRAKTSEEEKRKEQQARVRQRQRAAQKKAVEQQASDKVVAEEKKREAEKTLAESPLDGAKFSAIFREVIREMEWVSLTTLLQEQAIRAQLQQDMQNPSPQFIAKVAERQNMQPDQLIDQFKNNPQFAGAMMQQTVMGIIEQASQEFGLQKHKQLLKFMDRACASRGVTQEQLDAYKRVHEDDVKDTLARLTKVMSSQDLPDVDPPASFTKERCLKYMKQMHKLQEEVLEETLKGSSLDAADEGQMPSELEALVTGEAFEGNAQKEALEREYDLVNEDHKAEVLLQKFVLSNTSDMAFMMQVQQQQQQHVQAVQMRVMQLKKDSDAKKKAKA